MKIETKEKVKNIVSNCVNNTISRISKDSSFRPFHEALLSKELINASRFERSFSTSLGQGPVEEISYIVAADTGVFAERQKETMINVFKGSIDEIDRIMSALRSGIRTPDWQKEVKIVTSFTRGDTEVRRVLSDLFIKSGEKEIFISIKTVKPNLDQTEKAKKDMLLLKANNPRCMTYFGLFYNPGGPNRLDYNWTIPSKLFNMKNDECVLIGQDYWDTIGGAGTYLSLLDIFKEVGETTRTQLKILLKKS